MHIFLNCRTNFQPVSRSNCRSYEGEISKILGRSTKSDNYCNILHPTYKLHYMVRMVRKYKTYLDLPRGHEEPEIRALIEAMFAQYTNQRSTAQPTPSTSFRYIFLKLKFYLLFILFTIYILFNIYIYFLIGLIAEVHCCLS